MSQNYVLLTAFPRRASPFALERFHGAFAVRARLGVRERAHGRIGAPAYHVVGVGASRRDDAIINLF
jgi:hypothetical protein